MARLSGFTPLKNSSASFDAILQQQVVDDGHPLGIVEMPTVAEDRQQPLVLLRRSGR